MTATTFNGTVNIANNANNAKNVYITNTNTINNAYIPFVVQTNGYLPIYINSSLFYNQSTNTLTATKFNGTATNANNVTITNTNTTDNAYIPFMFNISGNTPFYSGTNKNLVYNQSTGTLTATTFNGTVNIANNANNAKNVYITNNNTNDTVYIPFVVQTNGYLPIYTILLYFIINQQIL